jgi:hypothetical protein
MRIGVVGTSGSHAWIMWRRRNRHHHDPCMRTAERGVNIAP